MDDFQQYPPGLLSALGINPEDLRRQQQQAGLLSAGLQLLAGSGYSPVRQSTGQLLGQAGMAGVQGMQQAGETAIDRALRGIQVSEFARRQKQEQAGRQALQGLYERMSGITPQGALAAPGGQAGPTAERAATIGKRQPMTAQELLAMATNPDISEAARKNLIETAQLLTPKPAQGTLGQFREALAGGEIPRGTTFEQFTRMLEKPTATVQVMPGESATQAGYAKFGVERNTAIYDAGQSAVRNLPKIDQTINLIKEGDPKTGFGAELVNNINRARSAFTGKPIQSISDTELLDSLLGSEVFPQIGALGIGAKGLDTPAEREFLRKVMTGTVTMDKNTLIRMAEIRRKYERKSFDTYNEAVDSGQFDDLFKFSRLPKRKLQLPTKVDY
jgi:hypothetical protein